MKEPTNRSRARSDSINKGKIMADSRKGTIARNDLKKDFAELDRYFRKIKACLDKMDELRIDDVVIDGVTKLSRCLPELKTFSHNLYSALSINDVYPTVETN